MTQVTVQIDDRYLREVLADVLTSTSDLRRVRRNAAWDTTKQVRTRISKLIRDRVAIKKRDLDPHLTAVRVGDGGKVSIKESKRLPLRDFGARQTKRGVTYRIAKDGSTVTGVEMGKGQSVKTSKARGGRGRVPDAFILNKFGGHVFRRVGKERLPIRKLMAVSAWGVFVKNDMTPEVEKYAQDQLEKNVVRRVNLEVLRRTGKVKA